MQPLMLPQQPVEATFAHQPPAAPTKKDDYLPIYPLHHGEEDRFTLFLNKKPGITQKTIRHDLERGTLSLALSYDPGTPLQNELKDAVLVSMRSQLVFKDGDLESLLIEGATNAGTMRLCTDLTVVQCDEVYNAFLGQASKIYLYSTFLFRTNNIVQELKSVIRLDALLHYHNTSSDDAPVLQLGYKYFDAVSNAYEDVPYRYEVDAGERAITIATAFMNRNVITSTVAALHTQVLAKLHPSQTLAIGTFNNKIKLQVIDDWQLPTTGNELLQDCPVINDSTSDFWVNRKNNQEWMAIPSFEIVTPALNEAFLNAPFSFVFRNLGPDVNAKPVLEGEIRITVRQFMSDAIKDAMKNAGPDKSTRLITPNALQYSVNIPYIDTDATEKFLTVETSEIKPAGDGLTQLLFRLNNSAVRTCYGCISADPPQQAGRPLQLLVNMSFSGYTLELPAKLNLANVINAKISAMQLVHINHREITDGDYFDLSANRLIKSNGEAIAYKDVSEKRAVALGVQMLKLHTPVKLNAPVLATTIRVEPSVLQTHVIQVLPAQVYKLQTFQRAVTLEVSFPCATFGNFYQEKTGDDYAVVGCRQAYQLGDPPTALYTEIEALRNTAYRIYRSSVSPSQFLVVPKTYIIGRRLPEEDAASDYKPAIMLYSTINVVDNTSTWVLDCTLMPDLTIAERLEMEHALKQYTPYQPEVNYITEVPVTTASGVLSVSNLNDTTLSAYPLGKGIRITISTKVESILILLDMLKRSAIDGEYTFTLEDKMAFTVQLAPRLDRIAGLWDTGPVVQQQNDQGSQLKNIGEHKIRVSKVRFYQADNFTELQTDLELEAQSSGPFAPVPKGTVAWAAYYTEADSGDITLEQINRYIEDVKCQLVFITMIDFSAKKIKDITVSYRLSGTADAFNAVLDPVNNNCEKTLLMPVTNFMMQRVVEYKVSNITSDDGAVHVGADAWITQDLASEGNIINIQSNLITF